MQFLNGWGETVANINERVFPQHPHGEFAICLEGSQVPVPAGAQRIDVPVKYMRVLARVELGANWDEAVALQRQFEFRTIGQPVLPTIPKTPIFDIEALLGVEAFEAAELALDSEADINPGMDQLQATTRAIARAVKDPATRARVDEVIRTKAFADIKKAFPTLGDGTVRNGWVLASTVGVYGKNWLLRTLVNDGGIWANTTEEVIYYKAMADPAGNPLSGDHASGEVQPRRPGRALDKIPAQEVRMKHRFAAMLLLTTTAGIGVAAQQQGSPLTPDQQQQVSNMPAMSEDKRVKTENIDSVMSMGDTVLLDVREPKEIEELGGYEGAINIPVTQLEKRLGELPKDKTILTA